MGEFDPDTVPDEWLQAAFDAIGRSGGADGDDQVRAILAAVLPLHEQQVRAGIVAELEAHAADCTAHDLPGEAASFEAAARYLRSDPEGKGDDG